MARNKQSPLPHDHSAVSYDTQKPPKGSEDPPCRPCIGSFRTSFIVSPRLLDGSGDRSIIEQDAQLFLLLPLKVAALEAEMSDSDTTADWRTGVISLYPLESVYPVPKRILSFNTPKITDRLHIRKKSKIF